MDECRWEVAATSEKNVQQLIEATGFTRPAAIALSCRGITAATVDGFLHPLLNRLTDPYALPGTHEAAKRLWEAVHRGERILIHGDYDTDGITAAALLSWVLRQNGGNTLCVLPHRIDDGYGLTPDSIDKALAEKFNLLVTVDCGITSYDAVASALAHGLDVIVTDHHTPGTQKLSATAIVNPKLPGSPPECADLAGVGVAFKVCHAFLKYGREHGLGGGQTDLRTGLDLVAIGTVADIVPLLHENRILVQHGLKVLGRQHRPGLHALCEMSGVRDVMRASDITYRLAPRLNAAGRMGDPAESLSLLQANSMADATALARALEKHNKQRQQIEEQTLVAAEEQISALPDLSARRTIVVWDEQWHQGVVGIVASRLARRYCRPAFVLTRDSDGQFVGSGRSVRQINLVDLLETCRDVLTRFGGHTMAAGLSLPAAQMETFCRRLEESAHTAIQAEEIVPVQEVCGQVSLAELTSAFFEQVELLEPFGHSNPEPVFVTHGVWPERQNVVAQKHTRGAIADASGARMDFIAFNRLVADMPQPPWSLVYAPQLNRFAGRCTPQARVLDVREAR